MKKLSFDKSENIFGTFNLFRQNITRLVGSTVRIQKDKMPPRDHIIVGLQSMGFVVAEGDGHMIILFPNLGQYIGRYSGYDIIGYEGESQETAVETVTTFRFPR